MIVISSGVCSGLDDGDVFFCVLVMVVLSVLWFVLCSLIRC